MKRLDKALIGIALACSFAGLLLCLFATAYALASPRPHVGNWTDRPKQCGQLDYCMNPHTLTIWYNPAAVVPLPAWHEPSAPRIRIPHDCSTACFVVVR